MKKLLALLLALMLVMVNVAALAEDPETPETPATPTTLDTSTWVSEATSFQTNGFQKTYDDADTTILPNETLQFVSEPDASNPDTTKNLTIDGYAATEKTGYIKVNIPSYSKTGIYKYTITETAGTSQGVTYSTESVGLTVLVEYDYDNECLKTVIGITKNAQKEKADEFTNKYEVGDLTISKTVSGNLGKQDQYFDVTVKLTTTEDYYVNSDITVSGASDTASNKTIAKGWTGDKEVTIKIKHGETIKFENIPKDVTYTVTEDAKHAEADAKGDDGSKGYTVTYTAQSGNITASTVAAVITNEKSVTVDTGVTLETLPYVLIMTIAMAGAVLMMVRRRQEQE